MSKKLGILTVIGNDRPGIIARVSGILFKNGCNLEDMSMTRLERHLAMMIIVCYEESKKKKTQADLETLAKSGLSFFWKDLNVKLNAVRSDRVMKAAATSCLVTAIGKDRTGIVYEVSGLMSALKLNITDLNSRVLGSGKNTLYSMMLEVDIPAKFSLSKLSNAAAKLAKKLNVEIQIKPVERVQC